MQNWLLIKDGVIVAKVLKDTEIVPEDYEGAYDTVTTDPSGLFSVGNVYSIEQWEEYNLTDAEKIDKAKVLATSRVEDMQNELLVEKLKGERYKAAVKEQTQAMEEQGRKLEKSKAELAKWRADVKKYESIEKHLPPKIIVERSNCEDINDYFSGLDGFSLDSLQ